MPADHLRHNLSVADPGFLRIVLTQKNIPAIDSNPRLPAAVAEIGIGLDLRAIADASRSFRGKNSTIDFEISPH